MDLCKRILASVDHSLNALGKLSIKQLMEFKGTVVACRQQFFPLHIRQPCMLELKEFYNEYQQLLIQVGDGATMALVYT